jgi:hypothetical protein
MACHPAQGHTVTTTRQADQHGRAKLFLPLVKLCKELRQGLINWAGRGMFRTIGH